MFDLKRTPAFVSTVNDSRLSRFSQSVPSSEFGWCSLLLWLTTERVDLLFENVFLTIIWYRYNWRKLLRPPCHISNISFDVVVVIVVVVIVFGI